MIFTSSPRVYKNVGAKPISPICMEAWIGFFMLVYNCVPVHNNFLGQFDSPFISWHTTLGVVTEVKLKNVKLLQSESASSSGFACWNVHLSHTTGKSTGHT